MKPLNFKFNKDNISIYVDGMYLDLHNLYDFKTIEYDIDKRNVNIYWEKGEGEYVPKDNPNLLKLEFKDVSLFNARERDIEMPYSEDTCLNFFGFLPKDKWNYYEGCFSHISTSDDDHFILELMSGAAFKIKAVNVMYYSNNANKK